MIGGFLGVLLAGHVWVVLLVVAIQTLVYKEVISIGVVPSKEKQLPWNRTIHWYFLISTEYYLYGELLKDFFKEFALVDAFLNPLATHHRFISFSMYCVGFVLFVINLKKGQYKFQFTQFGWVHMTLLLVICQSHFIVKNIFEGLIWLVLPSSLVICNDIAAYICGFFWGRTPLIRLSPKKTWEGFVGALVITVIFGFFFSGLLAQFPYMYCPVTVTNYSSTSLSTIVCPLPHVFTTVTFPLPIMLQGLLRWLHLPGIETLTIYRVQLHSLVMSIFASLVAPFGGFFASGFKRAFKIKDFGDSIPGHGGITDRMDCQFLMGVFSYMYYQSFIGSAKAVSVAYILEKATKHLSGEEMLELHSRIHEYLVGQKLIAP
ncbi:phosphatidate cytidylyltransferase [Blyttiomyces helicus]|uniref:Phosphatidate cytidylyltransferase n=1 Tax=Blyttiomyces helicus TaxID=388810 RepID=A0A4P9WML4_9FUNG|nr:phosphatidate cytidylyltransferase [Blyttiomyces helicus]|eukprot:RKO92918.1 phosphatidate cytidylyltransferase [Blyttiomyces helicus]